MLRCPVKSHDVAGIERGRTPGAFLAGLHLGRFPVADDCSFHSVGTDRTVYECLRFELHRHVRLSLSVHTSSFVNKSDASRGPKDCKKYVNRRDRNDSRLARRSYTGTVRSSYENGIYLSGPGLAIRRDGQKSNGNIFNGASNIRRSGSRTWVFAHPTLSGGPEGSAPVD